MPTVGVYEDALQEALGGHVTEESFDALCFEFGLELDDVTSPWEMAMKNLKDEKKAEGFSKRVIYKVDVPANRYDLLCVEGIARSLRVFKSKIEAPLYRTLSQKAAPNMTLTAHGSVSQIRPYVVAAVLRGVTFNQDRYDSFIDLQDKLHQNIGRRRTLASIGTHDLSTLTPPFTYEALPPDDIVFRPLNQDEEMNGHRMMEVLSQHQQLKAYLPIIRDSPVYPVIFDSKRVVCSLPPIINGEHSKIKMETKDVFIEVTATDLTKANIVLNTVVAMFSEFCDKPFIAEPVEVIYANDYKANSFTKPGDRITYPKLEPRRMEAKIDRMKQALSLDHLTEKEICILMRRMSVPCEIDKKDKNTLLVDVPITRSDIMHECDLVEDLAIAYGYNNLKLEIPKTHAGSSEQPVNHLTDQLRVEVAMAGFTECLNWALLSRKENFAQMRREEKLEELWRPVARPHEYFPSAMAVELSNSKTKDFQIVRTSVLPGVLKTLSNSKHNPPPIRLFELGDILVQEPTKETGSRNVRRICAVNANTKSQFHFLHGILDQIMYTLKCEPAHEVTENSRRRPFRLVPSDDPSFFPGMQAHIVVEDTVIGVIGELHPEVLGSSGFDVNLPTSAFELNLEPFLEWL